MNSENRDAEIQASRDARRDARNQDVQLIQMLFEGFYEANCRWAEENELAEDFYRSEGREVDSNLLHYCYLVMTGKM